MKGARGFKPRRQDKAETSATDKLEHWFSGPVALTDCGLFSAALKAFPDISSKAD